MSNKKTYKNAADEFFDKNEALAEAENKETIKNPHEIISKDNILDNTPSNTISNRNVIVVDEMFNKIQDNRVEGGTHSFYLTNKTFQALISKAKAKKISNSKFLEGILKQIFFEEE
jgi:hypothetical protein